MEIYDHAIDQYIERIIGISLGDHTEYHRKYAKKQIKETVKKPDLIFHKKKEMPPIHIKDRIAVVVGVKSGDGEELIPYKSKNEDLVVPTVYASETFTGDKNAKDEKLEA